MSSAPLPTLNKTINGQKIKDEKIENPAFSDALDELILKLRQQDDFIDKYVIESFGEQVVNKFFDLMKAKMPETS